LGRDTVRRGVAVDAISKARAMAFLEAASVAHIGVVNHGEPYVTPMSFVMAGDKILFRTKPGRRFVPVEQNPVVSIEVSSYDPEIGDWASVIVEGIAPETNDEVTLSLTVEKFYEKYREIPGSPLGTGGIQPLSAFPHVVVVKVDEISGMVSSGGLGMTTRPDRL